MSARNFDNIPPHATNTVTITTSPQVRVNPAGQLRPITVPVRPQPVPIRKVHHDGGASTSFSSLHVKDEPEALDYQGTSSSGPLLPGSSSSANTFIQYQRGTTSQASTSLHNNGSSNLSMDQPAPVNLASKVAEVFLTAGHAFQKLGDLTLQLHTTTDSDESKWSDKEVDNLRDALTRFAHELDQISTCVANRTTKHIKNDIKRRHMIDESNQQVKRMAMSVGGSAMTASGSGTTYTSLGNTLHSVPLSQKRVAINPTAKVVTTTRAIVPTRYTVPVQSMINGSNSGMPQLQQQQGVQGMPNIGRIARVAIPSTLVGKVTTANHPTKRIMPAKMSSGPLTSGAMVLEPND